MDGVPKHILMSSMGRGTAKRNVYELHGQTKAAGFAPLALWQLLPADDRPDEIWFLLTPQARATAFNEIEIEAAQLGVGIKPVLLPDNAADDTHQFLEIAANEIFPGCRLTLDVTQGLRHHAFLFYALALYLSEFREVEIAGVWYCRLETDVMDAVKPVIDLKPVLELAHWFHALAVYREQGSTGPISRLFEKSVNELRETARDSQDAHSRNHKKDEIRNIRRMASALSDYAFAFSSALPLELGKAACRIAREIPRLNQTQILRGLPLSSSLMDILREKADGFSLHEAPSRKGVWKKKIELTDLELRRQAKIIDSYLEHRQVGQAVGMMREWVISWLMLQNGESTHCWDYARRKPYEQRLGRFVAVLDKRRKTPGVEPTENQRRLGVFWNKLSDLRNTLMHNGMRENSMEELPQEKLTSVQQFWNELKHNELSIPVLGGGRGRLLVCPIGLTPGVLFSAIKQTSPDRVMIIASEESRECISDAILRSGRDVQDMALIFRDAYCGVEEFDRLSDQASHWLFDSDEIHVNLTGGTTLMGAFVSGLAKRAERSYERPVARFVLIDRRSPQEQRSDPWQIGRIHYLDGDPNQNSDCEPDDAGSKNHPARDSKDHP